MKNREIANPSHTREILERHGFTFKKSLGQNFLTEPNILRKIVQTAQIDDQVNVIEVGPGIGALTEHLSQNAIIGIRMHFWIASTTDFKTTIFTFNIVNQLTGIMKVIRLYFIFNNITT